jgi:hypothetical protein
VLSWQRLDHLFHGSGQIFGVLFDRKFGISEAQHAAAASSDIEQSALLGALDLQLQILLGDLEHGVRADGEGRGQGLEGRGTYINHNWLLLFLEKDRADKVRKHSNL